MKSEALRSQSPLSSAAEEEKIDAEKSSEFLMKVTSSAVAFEPHREIDTIEVLHSIDRRSASRRPWWAPPCNDDLSENDQSHFLTNTEDDLGPQTNVDAPLSPKSILSFVRKRTFATSLILLLKAPIISAVVIVALITSGFSQVMMEEEIAQADHRPK